MSSATRKPPATLDDLARVDGQAELIGGVIVHQPPMGYSPGMIVGEIVFRLGLHSRAIGRGHVFTSTLGYAVAELPSGRESFSPDASYYEGPMPSDGMDFIPGPPTFAAEARSQDEYGPSAEAAMAAKRAEYFQAGTLVVWDVDPNAGVIHCYRADVPERPTTFAAGEVADAEPAVPGWRVDVDAIIAG